MKRKLLTALTLSSLSLSFSASALNILLTNVDSWDTTNIQTLFDKL